MVGCGIASWLRRVGAALALLGAVGPSVAGAQDFPSRTVRLVAPAAPGGSFDVLARILARRLSETWRHPVIVENRPGGGGNIGALAVSKAEPDGYTLLVWNDALLINPHLYRDALFDPGRDFTPVSLSLYVPNVLVTHPGTGLRSFADVLKLARAEPGRLSYGSPGNGTPGHLSFELIKPLAGVDVVHVPYRGAGPAITDAVSGQIPLAMVAVAGAVGQIRGGTLVPLAVTSAQRIEALPATPTVAEQGMRDFRVNAWHGIFGPPGLPPAVAARLERDITAVLNEPEVRRRLIELGFEPAAGSAAQMAAIIERDFPIWRDVVGKSGAKAD
jgi:tripartite-type tricarboxylate transporter receptor subunit TctC